jgi:hypothetical protein
MFALEIEDVQPTYYHTLNRLKWEYLGLFVESRRTAKSLSIDEVWSEESWHGHGSKFDP